MGSFRLVAGNRHLHRYYNFAGRAVGDSAQIITPFMRVRTYLTREFRYLRTVIVTAAVHWGFDSMLAHLLLTFQHRAGVSSYTSSFDLAQTCVLVNSCLGRFSAAPSLEHPSPEVTGSICRVP